MPRYYITGGRQRKGAKGHIEWFSYGLAMIVEVDTESGATREVMSYETPAPYRPDDPKSNVVFKAGTRRDDTLIVCTQTEILDISLPDFRIARHVSHPWLNDVHHVMRTDDGNYLVADTGLDIVLLLTPDGRILREWAALPEENPWTRFDRDTDYRKVVTTKPHHCHPNYVFQADGEFWVTRFVQRDAFCLTRPERPPLAIGLQKPHDGVVIGREVYFTTVDGHVVVCSLDTGEQRAVYDLNEYTTGDKALGWCRGLFVLDARRVIVGFSRLRPSKFRENLDWLKHKIGSQPIAGHRPTRIACYDLAGGGLEWEIDLEPIGCNAVFSILPS